MRWRIRCGTARRSPCHIAVIICAALSVGLYVLSIQLVLIDLLPSFQHEYLFLYWLLKLAFCISLSCSVISQYRLHLSEPGYILPDVEAADAENWVGVTECQFCNVQRPRGAHHCRYCNACVLRREHHCPWVNNCVGLKNQWLFISFLAFNLITAVGSLFVTTLHIILYSCPKCQQHHLWNKALFTLFLALLIFFSMVGLLLQQVNHLSRRGKEILDKCEEEWGPVENDGDRLVREVGAWAKSINEAFGKQQGVSKVLIINPFWTHR